MKMIPVKATAVARQKGELMSDFISKEAAIQAVYDGAYLSLEKRHALANMIDRIPALKRKGKWVKRIGENGVTISLYCNQCGYENGHWYEWNYCPNCGAQMEESYVRENQTNS